MKSINVTGADELSDPRFRNKQIDFSSFAAAVDHYGRRLQDAISTVDLLELERACAVVEATAAVEKRIIAMGNGGSAAIASHLCCDWSKGTRSEGHPPVNCISLTDNAGLYSAIANDFGFERVFETQINLLGNEGDTVIAISSSGNSENIIRGVRAARSKKITTIGMTGFSGGQLNDEVDIVLYINEQNYGIIEDAHQALMHIIAQSIAFKRDTV